MSRIEEIDSSSDEEDDENINVLDIQRVDEEPLKGEDFDRFRKICRDLATGCEEECRGRIETIYNSNVVLEKSIEEARELVKNPELTVEEYNHKVRGTDGDPSLLRLVKRTIQRLRKKEPNLLNLNVRKLDALVQAKVYDSQFCPKDLQNLRWTHTPVWDQMTSVTRHDDRCLDITRAFLDDFSNGEDYTYLIAKYRGDIMRETHRVQHMTDDAGEWDRVMDESGVGHVAPNSKTTRKT
jgi:hypothetical protein